MKAGNILLLVVGGYIAYKLLYKEKKAEPAKPVTVPKIPVTATPPIIRQPVNATETNSLYFFSL